MSGDACKALSLDNGKLFRSAVRLKRLDIRVGSEKEKVWSNRRLET